MSTPIDTLAGVAALAGLDAEADRRTKAAHREMWSLGEYHTFARRLVWDVGGTLVRAAGVASGDRVLDVAAGSGNAAIQAAQAGARVTASDLTSQHFDAGRAQARADGVDLEWVEADAERLPFEDAAFDAVISCFGAIFAPDHRRVAAELLRVCRPGGTIALTAFTGSGVGGEFFDLVGRYAPPPPAGAMPPVAWGDEAHVRGLLGPGAASLQVQPASYVERAESPAEYAALFHRTFGPTMAIRAGLQATDPEQAAAFDRDLRDWAERSNRPAADGSATYTFDYALILARRVE